MVRSKLKLKPIFGLCMRAGHDPGIVDQQIKPGMANKQAISERANVANGTQFESLRKDIRVVRIPADCGGDPLSLRHIAGGDDHGGTF